MKQMDSKLTWISLSLVLITAVFLSLSWYHKEAPLKLAMNAETKQLFSSDVVELTLTVVNAGDVPVSDITASIELPEDLSLKTSSPEATRSFRVLRPGQSASLTVYAAHDGSPVQLEEAGQEDSASRTSIHSVARSLRVFMLILLLLSAGAFAACVILQKKDRVRMGILVGAVLFAGLLFPYLISSAAGRHSETNAHLVCSLTDGASGDALPISADVVYRTVSSEAEGPYSEYRVVFDMDGAEEQKALSVAPGAFLSDQDIPEREGLAFAGWYLDPAHTNLFEFKKEPVESDLLLYTYWVKAGHGWDSDKDGISDTEEKASGSDPYGADDPGTDTDGDGLPDYWETYLYHSDPANRDTDGDGLSDHFEAMRSDTDPTKKDTDGTGTSDDLRDEDQDGLTNLEEQTAGTEPHNNDTDNDGLPDGDEVKKARTDPLRRDTDSDSAPDGWETANGYDPLTKDEVFTVRASHVSVDGAVTASLLLQHQGDPSSIGISDVRVEQLLDGSIPGLIGGPFRFHSDVPVGETRISFTFDPASVSDGADPCIYHYNEDTRLLEEVSSTVENGTASALVKNLSVYVLLDRNSIDEVWSERIMNLNSDLYRTSVFDIAFVIDYSSSMNENDPDSLRLQIVRRFIEKLRDNQDQASVVQFAAKATTLIPLSSNKQALLNAVDSITNASGEGCNDRDMGTNGSDGIHAALEELKGLEHGFKYIIFLTDGEDTSVSYDYDQLIKEAVENDVTIFSIGMGDADADRLQHIAESTGGKYYFADSVDMDDTSQGSLMYVFHDIEISTIDLETDSNNDGISDYHTRLMCEGRLRTGTGTRLFEGHSFEEVQANDDFDRDGLKNGEEIPVAFDVASQKTYLAMVSSPTVPDSDGDGLRDDSDPAPLAAGISGGVCGSLSLVADYHEEDAGWTSGHVFFVFTSYIRQDLDLSAMAGGYSRKDAGRPWSFENLQRDEQPQKAYHMEPGDVVTLSCGTVRECGISGPGYGLEIFLHCSPDPDLGYDYLHNIWLKQDVTARELAAVLEQMTRSGSSRSVFGHISTEAVCRAWNRIGAAQVSPFDQDFAGGKIASSKGLARNMRRMTGAGEDLILEEELNRSHE